LNDEVERAAANIYYQANKQIDLINVYDWHFIPAAATLKNALNIPFVYSVESLEDHRSPNSNTPYNMSIKSIEWLGFYEAEKVSVKSDWMRNEVVRIYNVPNEKIEVVSTDTKSWMKDVLKLYSTVAGGLKGR
jgi:glycosyltransferase involved in cell wall biosynthesis